MKLPFAALFADTITDRSAYRTQLRKKPSLYGFRYLYFLLMILSVLSAVKMIVLASGLTSNASLVEQQKQLVKGLYPEELVIRVASGSITTNVQEPYSIPLPDQWKRWIDEDSGQYENLVVIDTQATSDKFPEYKTIVMLTKHSVVHPTRSNSPFGGDYEMSPIEPELDMTITKDTYQEGMAQVMPFVDSALSAVKTFLVVWVLIGPFIMAFVQLLWYALYLVMATLIIWGIDALFLKKNLRFEEIYLLSLFGITMPLVVTFALKQFDVTFPLLFTVIMVGWMSYILAGFPAKKTTVKA
jgi:Protein of unknown function (DUF1189)